MLMHFRCKFYHWKKKKHHGIRHITTSWHIVPCSANMYSTRRCSLMGDHRPGACRLCSIAFTTSLPCDNTATPTRLSAEQRAVTPVAVNSISYSNTLYTQAPKTVTGRLYGTIVGPTSRTDQSDRPVGPTIGTCKRPVRGRGQTGIGGPQWQEYSGREEPRGQHTRNKCYIAVTVIRHAVTNTGSSCSFSVKVSEVRPTLLIDVDKVFGHV